MKFNEETIILPLKRDGTLDFVVLDIYFPGASGLFYYDTTNDRQVVRLENGKFLINPNITNYYVNIDESELDQYIILVFVIGILDRLTYFMANNFFYCRN